LGEAYLPSVRHALAEIDKATEAIITNLYEKKVVIACPISLAQNWLTRMVIEFNVLHPDITVVIHGNIWSDEDSNVADIKLVSERNENAPDGFERLWRDKLTVVCAPNYTVKGRPIKAAEDMRDARLIHLLGRSVYWQAFVDHFGLSNWNLASGAQTNSLNIALELAANGQGCAILPKSLLETYLERKLLIEPLEVNLDSPWSCYVSNMRSNRNRPAHLLHAFLLSQAIG